MLKDRIRNHREIINNHGLIKSVHFLYCKLQCHGWTWDHEYALLGYWERNIVGIFKTFWFQDNP